MAKKSAPARKHPPPTSSRLRSNDKISLRLASNERRPRVKYLVQEIGSPACHDRKKRGLSTSRAG
ncbi:hypothetical protein BDW74DRAFT_160387 [Aspergillus multicolor]|uniref:uncharacterized protein n=1 Tax=Aspergillus multicolor TaxID=41759 RepID=UPI003CCDC762